MKALLLTEYMKLNLAEMAKPTVGPLDALVRVRACGICGSDVHGLDGSTGRRIPPLVANPVARMKATIPTAKIISDKMSRIIYRIGC